MAEVEHAGLSLQRAPGGLGDAHDGDVGSLHQGHVPVQAVLRRVLVVVGDAEEHGIGHLRLADAETGDRECQRQPAWDGKLHCFAV
jgi:hypothetical protein